MDQPPKNLRELYLSTRAHMLSMQEPAKHLGRASLKGDDGKRSPVGRFLDHETADQFRWAGYLGHTTTPLSSSVDAAIGRPLSPPEKEFLARAEAAHSFMPRSRWALVLDEAFAVAATRLKPKKESR